MKKRNLILFLFIGFSILSNAQSRENVVKTSKITIQSIDKNGESFAAHGVCTIVLQYSSGDIIIKTDAQTFKSGIDSIDNKLQKLNEQPIIFSSNIIDHLFRFNRDEDNGNMYNMQGVLTINENEINCIALFDPMAIGKKNDTRSYRMDFRLTTEADNVKILGLEDYLNERVLFEIGRGAVNVRE